MAIRPEIENNLIKSEVFKKMRCTMIIAFVAVVLSGCGYFPEEVWTNQEKCNYIGCETGGPVIYPHEPPEDKNEDGQNYEL